VEFLEKCEVEKDGYNKLPEEALTTMRKVAEQAK